jgi:hypothetical protein
VPATDRRAIGQKKAIRHLSLAQKCTTRHADWPESDIHRREQEKDETAWVFTLS